MTCCGFARAPDGSALCWADTESYVDGVPAESVDKLAVSPAGVVGLGAGWADTLKIYLDQIRNLGNASFDAAVTLLPPRLRAARDAKVERHRDMGIPYDRLSSLALIGAARAVVMFEERGFAPVEMTNWSSPDVGGRPRTGEDVLRVAQAQLAVIRRSIPAATGKRLTVARVSGAGVVSVRAPLLLVKEKPPAPAPAKPPIGDSPAHIVARARLEEDRRHGRG